MCHLATYYDQKFPLTEFECLLGVKEGHHNVILVMEKLVWLIIMKVSCNQQGSIVYGFVDTLRIHLRYDEEKDDSIQKDLDRLFREGNDIIKKRGCKRKQASKTSNNSEETDERKF